jgi:REP element-mobilizing transposase RayT
MVASSAGAHARPSPRADHGGLENGIFKTNNHGLKAYVTKKTGMTWQSGFFDYRLRTGESFAEKASYIRNNPVRAGLVKEPKDWRWILENR